MSAEFLLRIELTPEAHATMARFASMPQRLPRAMMAGLDAALEVGYQQALKTNFNGPSSVSGHALAVRTGRLHGSFLRLPSRLEGTSVVGVIGSNPGKDKKPVKYWFAHEFGFDGTVSVAAHSRQTAQREDGSRVRVRTALRSKKPHTFRTQQVKAHTRHMRIPERAMMRTGLTNQIPEMSRIFSGVVVRDLNGRPTT